MNIYIKSVRTVPVFLAIAGLSLAATPVAAQEETEILEKLVVVQAPIAFKRKSENRASHPVIPSEIVELKRPVSFADLDLADSADVMELDTRIKATAEDACEMLAEMFPFDATGKAEIHRCMKRAIASALDQKERAIAAAH
jgi:UrcA family protein